MAVGIVSGDPSSSSDTSPDYSKESVVVQELAREIRFASDGSWTSVERASILVQSDVGLRQLGVLSFSYDRFNQSLEVRHVRVRKPDGSVVATPADSVQDLSSEVSRLAPTYSDIHEKQIPVKALGIGDVLEYESGTFKRSRKFPATSGIPKISLQRASL